MTDFEKRLNEYLETRALSPAIEILTPDASTREYFRVNWSDSFAIACVYPEPFIAAEQSYLDVTDLFRRNGLPVAEVYDFDEKLGVIVQEDLGNTILREVLGRSDEIKRNSLLNHAISLIAKIQTATIDAISSGSVAGKLKFDVEKLVWELEFFRTHYFETFKKSPLSSAEVAALDNEFHDLAADLESRATVLCHRDFHAANLMLDKNESIRIIDHQDARIGSPTYDLVSLLLDRVNEPPSPEWLTEKRRYFLEQRANSDLPALDEGEFKYEFSLQAVQRCLKAVGTFSFQSVNRGKTYFIPFIKPMFAITRQAIDAVDRFPRLRDVINRELEG